jgi:hypothetical protein
MNKRVVTTLITFMLCIALLPLSVFANIIKIEVPGLNERVHVIAQHDDSKDILLNDFLTFVNGVAEFNVGDEYELGSGVSVIVVTSQGALPIINTIVGPDPTPTETPTPTPTEAGPTPTEGGPTPTEGGPTPTEAGPTPTEAGPTPTEGPTLRIAVISDPDQSKYDFPVGGGSHAVTYTLTGTNLNLLPASGMQALRNWFVGNLEETLPYWITVYDDAVTRAPDGRSITVTYTAYGNLGEERKGYYVVLKAENPAAERTVEFSQAADTSISITGAVISDPEQRTHKFPVGGGDHLVTYALTGTGLDRLPPSGTQYLRDWFVMEELTAPLPAWITVGNTAVTRALDGTSITVTYKGDPNTGPDRSHNAVFKAENPAVDRTVAFSQDAPKPPELTDEYEWAFTRFMNVGDVEELDILKDIIKYADRYEYGYDSVELITEWIDDVEVIVDVIEIDLSSLVSFDWWTYEDKHSMFFEAGDLVAPKEGQERRRFLIDIIARNDDGFISVPILLAIVYPGDHDKIDPFIIIDRNGQTLNNGQVVYTVGAGGDEFETCVVRVSYTYNDGTYASFLFPATAFADDKGFILVDPVRTQTVVVSIHDGFNWNTPSETPPIYADFLIFTQ